VAFWNLQTNHFQKLRLGRLKLDFHSGVLINQDLQHAIFIETAVGNCVALQPE
jgi:hypothetical protein